MLLELFRNRLCENTNMVRKLPIKPIVMAIKIPNKLILPLSAKKKCELSKSSVSFLSIIL